MAMARASDGTVFCFFTDMPEICLLSFCFFWVVDVSRFNLKLELETVAIMSVHGCMLIIYRPRLLVGTVDISCTAVESLSDICWLVLDMFAVCSVASAVALIEFIRAVWRLGAVFLVVVVLPCPGEVVPSMSMSPIVDTDTVVLAVDVVGVLVWGVGGAFDRLQSKSGGIASPVDCHLVAVVVDLGALMDSNE